MIFFMVIFSYFIVSRLMLTFKNGSFEHVNKLYMALIMGSLMGVINEIIMLYNNYTHSTLGLIVWISVSIGLILMLRKQVFVSDNEYLKSMIEHHDSAVFMSEEILRKSNDVELKDFAQQIIDTQQKEIEYMRSKLE